MHLSPMREGRLRIRFAASDFPGQLRLDETWTDSVSPNAVVARSKPIARIMPITPALDAQ
jgi:hypothetical protein